MSSSELPSNGAPHSSSGNLQDYLAQHDLETIFKEMMAALLFHKPTRPLEFMSESLSIIQKQTEKGTGTIDYPHIFHDYAERTIGSRRPSNVSVRSVSESRSSFQSINDSDQQQQLPPPSLLKLAPQIYIDLPDMSMTKLMARRGSVSAESLQPADDKYERTIIDKDQSAKLRIASAIRNNLLFRNLEQDQRQEVVDAMFECRITAGDRVIIQGDEGDNFYVVDEGIFDIYVNDQKVVDVGPSGSFGELALMYNTPRAATVVARTNAIIWAVDRVTFQRTVMNNAFRKRKMYEGFLRSVPVLQSLHISELVRIADALEPMFFDDGHAILREGERGDRFYLLVEGEAIVTQSGQRVGQLHSGDYFGEIALITDLPRVASVTSKGSCKCVSLDTSAFIRLLGPCMDILQRNMENYHIFKSFIQNP